jgi:hypothetical protein
VSEGYFEYPTDEIFGTPDAGDPVVRARLQEASQRLAQSFTTAPGYVPGGVHGPRDPIIGWTAQRSAPPPFRPYTPTGSTPDWTSDVNPIGAGGYDQNPVVRSFPVNPLNQGPIGSILFDGYSDSGDTNPNAPRTDESGTIEELEY